MTGRRGVLWLLAGIALALIAGRVLASVYGGWSFHQALGTGELWNYQSRIVLATKLVVFLSVLAFTFANFFAVRQSIVSLVLPRHVGDLEIPEVIPLRRLTFFALGGSFAIATAFTIVSYDWTMIALAMGGTPFGEIDPYLNRDLRLYTQWLPFERALHSTASVLLLLTSVFVVVLYAMTPSVRWQESGLYVSMWVRRHVGILGALAVALVGWGWRLDRFGLLTVGSGTPLQLGDVAPFGAYDHRVLIPYLTVLSFLSLPLAFVLAWSMWKGYLRLSLVLVSLVIIGGPVARGILPLAAKPALSGPVAEARERPYLSTRRLFTRRAFGVDQIVRSDTVLRTLPSMEEVARWSSSWDPAALKRYVERDRRGSQVAAVGWSGSEDGMEVFLLRAPDINAPPGTKWPIDIFRPTGVDAIGSPSGSLATGADGIPGVYVYDGAPRYVIIADSSNRIEAPAFESTLSRIAHAWDQQNPRLLAAEPPYPRPRIMAHRDVRERVRMAAPFLEQGEVVWSVVRGDSLYWVMELFTVASEYPLAERIGFGGRSVHYAQHAATAVVQSQTGGVTIIPVGRPDALMQSWMRMVPSAFTSRREVPRWMSAFLPPPVDWGLIQWSALTRTGFLGDTTLFTSVSRVDDADVDLLAGPLILSQLDSAGTMGFRLPVVGPDSVVGVLAISGGADARTVYASEARAAGWTEILERLQIGAEEGGFGRSLPHSRRGRVQTLESSEGVLFAQSYYDWPPEAPPRLAGVVVISGGETLTGRSLADALGYSDESSGLALPIDLFRARVIALYEAMSKAQREGDWRAYGDAWTALGRLLGRDSQ